MEIIKSHNEVEILNDCYSLDAVTKTAIIKKMNIKLILGRTLNDQETSWVDTKIIEVEIPLEKQNPDGYGNYNVIGCTWPERID